MSKNEIGQAEESAATFIKRVKSVLGVNYNTFKSRLKAYQQAVQCSDSKEQQQQRQLFELFNCLKPHPQLAIEFLGFIPENKAIWEQYLMNEKMISSMK